MASNLSRRSFLVLAGAAALRVAGSVPSAAAASARPNFIVIFSDDLGYGDLSCYGNPVIRTPELDRMALDGLRMTSFYAAASVCSPSRAALLTGRYPVRCGMPGNTGPGSDAFLPESEITIAQALKGAGYRTMAIGKWHLGHQRAELLPTGRGFDSWFGLPYSNDMRKPFVQSDEPLKLYRNTEPIEFPVNQDTLTERYTDEAVKFIESCGDEPFFLYLAHSMPHLPIHTTEPFRGKSRGGLYGDVIGTIDWGVGRIRETLRARGLDQNTCILFTSDNGPWLDLPDRMLQEGNERWHAGSPGPFRGAKGTTYEGGFRVPMIACWPGVISAGSTTGEMATTMDFMPTFLAAAGVDACVDRTLDGRDITALLKGEGSSPHEEFWYFRGPRLEAIRRGEWKLRKAGDDAEVELYHLGRDPSERYNLAAENAELREELLTRLEAVAGEVKKN